MLDERPLNEKEKMMSDIKTMQTAFIIREDLDISHNQIQTDYRFEMNMIAIAIQSIIAKATPLGEDK